MSLLQLIGKSQGAQESPWPRGTAAVFRLPSCSLPSVLPRPANTHSLRNAGPRSSAPWGVINKQRSCGVQETVLSDLLSRYGQLRARRPSLHQGHCQTGVSAFVCPKACPCQAPCWAFNSQGRQGSLQHRPWPLGAKWGRIGAQKAIPCIGEQQREQESQRPKEKPAESSSAKAPRRRAFKRGGRGG